MSSCRTGRAGAIFLLGLALLFATPSARAEVPEVGEARRGLQRAAAALDTEADVLESLASDPQLGDPAEMIALAGYLAATEVRVWRLEVGVGNLEQWASPGDREAYRAARGRISGLLETLGRAAAAAASAGDLPPPGRACPVSGEVDFAPTWGEERPWGRTHKGEDLHAPAGTPLVAVESGTILQSGWHWQGGFGVWLEGDYSGDIYYYAHLAWLAPAARPGEMVEVGDLLGWVGSTGNATSPHLHFGWIPDEIGGWPDLGGLTDPHPLMAGLCG